MAAYLFIRKYKEAKENVTEETERIINAAANLIKALIRERYYSNEIYPATNNILTSAWIPPSLELFLNQLLSYKYFNKV